MSPTRFEIVATTIFLMAVIHTLLSPLLYNQAMLLAQKKRVNRERWKFYHFSSEVLLLLGEIEVIFGIWLVPLFIWFGINKGWSSLLAYLNGIDFTNPLYILVIVVAVGTRPIITFVERILEWIARLGGDTPGAWWWTILTIAPLFGSAIKEPGAMAIASILLAKKFFAYHPSKKFCYATLALLLANVSVGGLLTSFSSLSLFNYAKKWDYTTWKTFSTIGWKAVIAIIVANFIYYLFFRKHFRRENFPKRVPTLEKDEVQTPTPVWITIVHILFVIAIAFTGEHAPLFMGIFLLFLGFHHATSFYQTPLKLKRAALLGFFFASLIIHGELQGWWVAPILENLSRFPTFIVSSLLSMFVDNATVSFIVIDVPQLDAIDRYLLITGTMAAGGLTVIASGSNPIGISILRSSFFGKISFLSLFLAALMPVGVFLTIFWFLRLIPMPTL